MPTQLFALQAIGIALVATLFAVGCRMAPAYPGTILGFLDDPGGTYLWAGPAGALLGLGYGRLAGAVAASVNTARVNRAVGIFLAAFLATIVMLAVAPTETTQFYLLLLFLFPCSILVYGVNAGQPWAVVFGIILNLLIGLASPSGPGRDIGGLLVYAIVFVAASELAFTSASYKVLFERELAAAPDGKGRGMTRTAIEGAVRNYWPRVAMLILGASLAVSAALAVFQDPLLFGTQYAESLEAAKITALLLPALIVLAIVGLGLLLPKDLPARAHQAWARARLRFRASRLPAPRIDMPHNPEGKEAARKLV